MLKLRKWNPRHSSLFFCNLLPAALAAATSFTSLFLWFFLWFIQQKRQMPVIRIPTHSKKWHHWQEQHGLSSHRWKWSKPECTRNKTQISEFLTVAFWEHFLIIIRIHNLQYTLTIFLANVNLDFQSKYLFNLRQSTSIITLEFQDNVNFLVLVWARRTYGSSCESLCNHRH